MATPERGASRARAISDLRRRARARPRPAGGRRAAAAALAPAHPRGRRPPHGAGRVAGGRRAGAARTRSSTSCCSTSCSARTSGLELLERLKRERPEVEVDHDDRPREHRERRGLHPARRLRLSGEALRRRPPRAHDRRKGARAAPARAAQPGARGGAARARRRRPSWWAIRPAMRALLRTIHSLRHNESHVLIQGESGTGKELVARAIHATSPRSGGGLRAGRLRRAARDDHRERALRSREGRLHRGGRVRRACSGWRTAGRSSWTRSARFRSPSRRSSCGRSRTRRCARSGRPRTVPVDIRVISATHRDLAAMVDEGRFRTDLFYRLNVVRIEIPPLRERREDIPLLVHHFLRQARPAIARAWRASRTTRSSCWSNRLAGQRARARERDRVGAGAGARAAAARRRPASHARGCAPRRRRRWRESAALPRRLRTLRASSARCGSAAATRRPPPGASASAAAPSTASSPSTASRLRRARGWIADARWGRFGVPPQDGSSSDAVAAP